MPGKKPHYTLAEHTALGAILAEVRDTLVSESTRLSNAYPFREKAPNALRAAIQSLDDARSHLDDLACKENPDAGRSAIRAYYPLRERRPARAPAGVD